MSIQTLEQELAVLKQRMTDLEATVGQTRKSGQRWKEAFGAMKGDTLAREAAKLGSEYRARQNKKK
jgi:hypothetical protein